MQNDRRIKELGRTLTSNPAHFGKAVSAALTGKARVAYRLSAPLTSPPQSRQERCKPASGGGSRKRYVRDTEREGYGESTSPDDGPDVSKVMFG